MRLELLGGGGVRVPHLVYRLLAFKDRLDLDEILLYDADRRRVERMAALCTALAQRRGIDLPLRILDRPGGGGPVDFVLTAIRPGGDAGRARDERLCREVGLLGQETTGACGFLMALRTLGPLSEIVLRALETSPEAWVLNFTNPAGLMTEGLVRRGVSRTAGLCDTPSHLLEDLEAGLGLGPEGLEPHYFGLNHLGFFTALRDRDGRNHLPALLADYDRMATRIDTLRYFPAEVVRAIGNLPVEYVHFYLDRSGSLARQALSEGRGAQIEAINRTLWQAVADALPERPDDALDAYLKAMATRSATYLQAETGAARTQPPDWQSYLEEPGYEVVAIRVIEALRGAGDAQLLLDVAGGGAVVGAPPEEVYETLVRVDPQGLHVKPVTAPAEWVRGLVGAVKTYERLALDAAAEPSRESLLAALTAHPLVADAPRAIALLDRARDAGVEVVAGCA